MLQIVKWLSLAITIAHAVVATEHAAAQTPGATKLDQALAVIQASAPTLISDLLPSSTQDAIRATLSTGISLVVRVLNDTGIFNHAPTNDTPTSPLAP